MLETPGENVCVEVLEKFKEGKERGDEQGDENEVEEDAFAVAYWCPVCCQKDAYEEDGEDVGG